VFNCLNQFLLTAVLSIQERVFLVQYVFREGNRYTDLGTYGPLARRILLQQTFICEGAAKSTMYPDHPRTLNELKSAITVYIRNISQADLHKVFANKIKRVQACMDARGRHFQHLL
jgi:hypothetical protein